MLAQINIKWLLINLLAMVVLLAGWLLWQQRLDNTPDTRAAGHKPDYFLLQATSMQYDKSGQLSSKISGQRFTHIMAFAVTDIDAPSFQLLQPNHLAWFGRADSATVIDSGAQINLDGKVFITNGPAPGNPLSLITESLKILPQQSLLMGHQKARIQGNQSQLQSHGLKLHMDTQVLTLFNQVRGQLKPGN